jgi:hypothetical protein
MKWNGPTEPKKTKKVELFEDGVLTFQDNLTVGQTLDIHITNEPRPPTIEELASRVEALEAAMKETAHAGHVHDDLARRMERLETRMNTFDSHQHTLTGLQMDQAIRHQAHGESAVSSTPCYTFRGSVRCP